MADERRQKLLATIGGEVGASSPLAVAMPAPKGNAWHRRIRWFVMFAAACVVIGLMALGLLFPSISGVKESARRTAAFPAGTMFSREAARALQRGLAETPPPSVADTTPVQPRPEASLLPLGTAAPQTASATRGMSELAGKDLAYADQQEAMTEDRVDAAEAEHERSLNAATRAKTSRAIAGTAMSEAREMNGRSRTIARKSLDVARLQSESDDETGRGNLGPFANAHAASDETVYRDAQVGSESQQRISHFPLFHCT
jgi:hypothetical protein